MTSEQGSNARCEICGAKATTFYRDLQHGRLERPNPIVNPTHCVPDSEKMPKLFRTFLPGLLHQRCDEHPGKPERVPASPEDSEYNIALCAELGIELVPTGDTCAAAS